MQEFAKNIICHIIVLTFCIVSGFTFHAHAEEQENVINDFRISVNLEGTSISLNAPTDFTYTENSETGEIEFRFINCSVNVQNHSCVRIPFYSPALESVELIGDYETGTAVLSVKLADYENKPRIYVQPSKSRIVLEFKPGIIQAKSGIEPKTIFEDTGILEKSAQASVSHEEIAAVDEDTQDMVVVSSESESEFPEIEAPESDAEIEIMADTNMQGDEIEDTRKEETSGDLSEGTPEGTLELPSLIPESEFPKTSLDAIHYSQGRVDRDVITFEFDGASPVFHYEISDSNHAVITFHNLITPKEILPEDRIQREVKGTNIKSLTLVRFEESGIPALQILLLGKTGFTIELEDLKGIITVTIYGGDE